MFECCIGRCKARKLARVIIKSLFTDSHWEVKNHPMYPEMTVYTKGLIQVVSIPARFRVFDRIFLSVGNAEVWLPLISRLRLRSAMRYRAVVFANALISEGVKNADSK